MNLCVTVEGSPRVNALPSSSSSTWPEMSNKSNLVSLLPHLVYMLQLSLQIITVRIKVLSRWQHHLLHQTIFRVLGGHIHKTCNIQLSVSVQCVTMDKCMGYLCKSRLNTESQPLQLKFKWALYKQHDKIFTCNMSIRHHNNVVCFPSLRVYTGHKT